MSRNGDKISKPVKCISSPTPVCVVSWSGYLRCQLPTLLVLRCNALVISPPPNGPLHTGTYVLKTTTSWSGYLRCQLPTLLVLRCNALVITPTKRPTLHGDLCIGSDDLVCNPKIPPRHQVLFNQVDIRNSEGDRNHDTSLLICTDNPSSSSPVGLY